MHTILISDYDMASCCSIIIPSYQQRLIVFCILIKINLRVLLLFFLHLDQKKFTSIKRNINKVSRYSLQFSLRTGQRKKNQCRDSLPESSRQYCKKIFIYLFFYLPLFTVDGKDLDNMYKKIHKIVTVANHRQLSYFLEKSDTEVKVRQKYDSISFLAPKRRNEWNLTSLAIFQEKGVIKNHMLGSLRSQIQVSFEEQCLFLRKHKNFLNQTVEFKCFFLLNSTLV